MNGTRASISVAVYNRFVCWPEIETLARIAGQGFAFVGKENVMPDLEDVTTSEVTDPEVPDNESAGDEETVAEPESVEPDGFAVRDAKIAELAATVTTLQAENQALRAHNYDLIMSAAPSPEPGNSGGEETGGEESPRGVDDLFADRG